MIVTWCIYGQGRCRDAKASGFPVMSSLHTQWPHALVTRKGRPTEVGVSQYRRLSRCGVSGCLDDRTLTQPGAVALGLRDARENDEKSNKLMRAYSRREASQGVAMRTHGNLFLRAFTADGYRTYAVTYGRVIIAGERRMTRVTRTYDSYDLCSIVAKKCWWSGSALWRPGVMEV